MRGAKETLNAKWMGLSPDLRSAFRFGSCCCCSSLFFPYFLPGRGNLWSHERVNVLQYAAVLLLVSLALLQRSHLHTENFIIHLIKTIKRIVIYITTGLTDNSSTNTKEKYNNNNNTNNPASPFEPHNLRQLLLLFLLRLNTTSRGTHSRRDGK